MARKAFVDLRAHKRFQLNDGVVAIYLFNGAKFGRIRDISLGGLSVCHYDGENWEENCRAAEIVLAGYDFCLDGVPPEIISDVEVVIETPYKKLSERWCAMRFRELPPEQLLHLEHIIRKHSVDEELALCLDDDEPGLSSLPSWLDCQHQFHLQPVNFICKY